MIAFGIMAAFKRFLPRAALACALTWLAFTARAATPIPVSSPSTGKLVYEILEPGEAADPKPGIYGEGKAGSSMLLLPGQVLGINRFANGIVGHLPLSAITQRNEVAVVLDGKVTILSSLTRANKPKTFITIGSGANAVVDVGGNQFRLEPIVDPSAVVLAFRQFSGTDGQPFLLSIRQKNSYGDGVTIAGFARPPLGPEPADTLALARPPVIIDYSFLSAQKLQSLFPADGSDADPASVLSRNHLLALAQGTNRDSRLMAAWRLMLREMADHARSGRPLAPGKKGQALAESNLDHARPMFNVQSGESHLGVSPRLRVLRQPFSLVQEIDPFVGTTSVLASPSDPEDFADFGDGHRPNVVPLGLAIRGSIDYDAAKSRYRVYKYSATTQNGRNGAIAFVDGKPILIYFKDRSRTPTVVPLGTFIPASATEFVFTLTELTRQMHGSTWYEKNLVASMKLADRSTRTAAIVIEERSGAAVLTARELTLSKAFMSESEIERRTAVEVLNMSDAGGSTHFVYDGLTTSESLPASQRDARPDRTTALIDVTLSTAQRPYYFYRAPQEKHALAPRVAWFRFDAKGTEVDSTGVYVEVRANSGNSANSAQRVSGLGSLAGWQDRPEVSGQILRADSSAGSPQPLDSYRFKSTGEAVEGNLDLYPLGSEQKPKSGFSVLGIASVPAAGSGDPGAPYLFQVPVDAPFDQVEAVKLLRGRRQTNGKLFGLIFFRDARGPDTVRSRTLRGGVASFTVDFSVAQRSRNASDVVPSELQWLTREPRDAVQMVRDGFVFDADGNLYMKENPELAQNDRRYSVRALDPVLGSVGSMYPNQGGGVALRHSEVVLDETDSLKRLVSAWVVYGPQALYSRYKGLEDKVKKRLDRARKTDREDLANADLYAFLDSLALAQSPVSHYVLLVASDRKDYFTSLLQMRLATNSDGPFSVVGADSRHFNFAIFDPSASGKALRVEFERLRDGNSPGRRALLYADAADIVAQAGVDLGKTEPDDGTEPSPDEAGPQLSAPRAKSSPSIPAMMGALPEGPSQAQGAADGAAAKAAQGSIEDDSDDRAFPPFSRISVLAGEGQNLAVSQIAAHATQSARIPQLIIATPREWRALERRYANERRNKVFDSFTVKTDFLTGTWTKWPPETPGATPLTNEQARRPIAREDFDVFPSLDGLLTDAASASGSHEHRILVVPEELKGLVSSLIQTRWATDSRRLKGPWNYSNRQLALFQPVAGFPTQEEVLTNFDAMRGAASAGRAVAFFAQLSDLISVGRPVDADESHSFHLEDPSAMLAASAIDADVDAREQSEASARQIPHMLWWVAAEGQRVQPEARPNWSLREAAGRKVSVILVATEKDLAAAQNDVRFERRFVDLTREFTRIDLPMPSDQVKEGLVAALFARSEIEAIQYKYELNAQNSSQAAGQLYGQDTQLSGADARQQLIATFVSRVNQIAKQTKIDPTSAFLRAFAELRRRALDAEWRREQVISQAHFERMFSDIFSIPKNPRSLKANDWLLRFKDPRRAAMGIANEGYPSPMPLREQFAELFWSVTKGPNEAIPLPNSVIIIGNTSTGKTRLFRRTYKYAGLEEYNPEAPSDDKAGYWIIPVGTITKAGTAGKDVLDGPLTIDRLEANILNLLAINPSAQIVFDDVHKAGSKEVLEWILGFVNRLFEARDGLITVRRLGKGAEPREIPVRNIGLGMTINPNPSRAIRADIIEAGKDDIYGNLVAAFSVFRDLKIEQSLFARFAARIDMSRFPIEARVPTIIMNVLQATQAEFASDSTLRLPSPEVLADLTGYFSGAHARDLIQGLTTRLTELPRNVVAAPIYIRSLTTRAPGFVRGAPTEDDAQSAIDEAFDDARKRRVGSRDVANYLQEHTELIAVRRDSPDTLVDFIAYMLNGFRIHVYNGIFTGAQKDEWLAEDANYRERLFPQLVAAGMHNIEAVPFVPLSRVNLRPDQLGQLNLTQVQRVLERITELSFEDRDMFPIDFQATSVDQPSLRDFLGTGPSAPKQRTRIDLMSETTGVLIEILENAFEAYFRASFRSAMPTPNQYILNLPQDDPTEIFKQMGERVASVYRRFTFEIRSADLLEQGRADASLVQNYETARLFLMTVDRAIAQMPWGVAGEFMYSVVERANANPGLSGRAEYQALLFESKLSPLAPVTPDLVRQTAQASGALEKIDMNRGAANFRQFYQRGRDGRMRCEAIIYGTSSN